MVAPTVPLAAEAPVDGAKSRLAAPLVYSGLLDQFKSRENTPVIGRTYEGFQVASFLEAPNTDELIRDLAATVSQRGVVFLREQEITPKQMVALGERISYLSGAVSYFQTQIVALCVYFGPQLARIERASCSSLTEESSELGDQVSVISSEKQKKGGGLTMQLDDKSRFASVGWHSDITFEPVPSNYAMLKIHTLPETGGDTIWASAYEAYSRLSPSLAAYLETLTATHDAKFFHDEARRLGQPIRAGVRGNSLNQGPGLEAVHPVIRTNPVTGWKGIFVNKGFTRRINEVTKDESDILLPYLLSLVTQNHDLQVRYTWGKNDLAIWDNRSTYHCATYDYEEARAGDRVCSLGERPYFDPQSTSRREALARS